MRVIRNTNSELMRLVALLGLALRLALIAVLPGNPDIANFAATAAIVRTGRNLYAEQYFYNYSPIIGWLIALLPPPFGVTYRAALSLVTLVDAWLIASLSGQRKALVFALCWCCPVMVLYDASYGQFENVALAPILLAVLYAAA